LKTRHEGEPGPLTLGQTLTSHLRLIVWYKSCGRQAEPDVAELAAHHGAVMTVIDRAARLACSRCEAREADFVISGARR